MPQTRPLRLTLPQMHALQYLKDGWRCESGGAQPSRFRNLTGYPFRHQDQTTYVAGTTLASLQRRTWIAWEATTLTLAYDGSHVPGYTLVLTDAGRTVAV